MAPSIIVRGERIGLGPLASELVPLYHRWFNDLAVQRTTRHPGQVPLETLLEDLDSYVRSDSNQPFTI